MTKFIIKKIKEFRNLINYLRKITNDIEFNLNEDGLNLWLDNILYINLLIPKDNLEKYEIDENNRMCVNIDIIWKLIKYIPKNDEIHFDVKKEKIHIFIKERNYNIKLINLDIEKQKKVKFDMKGNEYFEFKGKEYSKIIKNILKLNDEMGVSVRNKKIIFDNDTEASIGFIEIERYLNYKDIERRVYKISDVNINNDDLVRVFIHDRLTICINNSFCDLKVSYPLI
jgi:hypothetical protein